MITDSKGVWDAAGAPSWQAHAADTADLPLMHTTVRDQVIVSLRRRKIPQPCIAHIVHTSKSTVNRVIQKAAR